MSMQLLIKFANIHHPIPSTCNNIFGWKHSNTILHQAKIGKQEYVKNGWTVKQKNGIASREARSVRNYCDLSVSDVIAQNQKAR